MERNTVHSKKIAIQPASWFKHETVEIINRATLHKSDKDIAIKMSIINTVGSWRRVCHPAIPLTSPFKPDMNYVEACEKPFLFSHLIFTVQCSGKVLIQKVLQRQRSIIWVQIASKTSKVLNFKALQSLYLIIKTFIQYSKVSNKRTVYAY